MMQLLTKQEAGARVRMHPESLMRLAREGRFPKPLKATASAKSGVRFVAAEIEEWIAERMGARS
jgi:predicted DNA-binding transcriptional regulator AlpA